MKRDLLTGRWNRCLKGKARGDGLNRGGAGSACASGNGQNGGFGLTGNFDRGLEKFGEGFDAGGKARAGARKVAVSLKRVHAAVSNGRNGMPRLRERHGLVFVASPLGGVAARSDEQDFRRSIDHIFDGDSKGRRAGAAENVFAPGKVDHFRNPVAADVKRLQPFQKGHSRTIRRFRYLLLERAETRADLFQQRFRPWATAGFFSYPKNIAPDVAQILRIEAENFRAPVETRERGSEIIGRGGANMAQVLGDDQIRSQCLQHLGVDGVQTFATVNVLANEGVDFRSADSG